MSLLIDSSFPEHRSPVESWVRWAAANAPIMETSVERHHAELSAGTRAAPNTTTAYDSVHGLRKSEIVEIFNDTPEAIAELAETFEKEARGPQQCIQTLGLTAHPELLEYVNENGQLSNELPHHAACNIIYRWDKYSQLRRLHFAKPPPWTPPPGPEAPPLGDAPAGAGDGDGAGGDDGMDSPAPSFEDYLDSPAPTVGSPAPIFGGVSPEIHKLDMDAEMGVLDFAVEGGAMLDSKLDAAGDCAKHVESPVWDGAAAEHCMEVEVERPTPSADDKELFSYLFDVGVDDGGGASLRGCTTPDADAEIPSDAPDGLSQPTPDLDLNDVGVVVCWLSMVAVSAGIYYNSHLNRIRCNGQS